MTTALENHLSRFYTEHVLRGKPTLISVQRLKDAMQAEPNLRSAAQSRLNELNRLDASTGGNLARRCYVSHVQKMGLEEALR